MGGEFNDLENYILNYWPKLRQENTLETKTALGLPYPYYVPSIEVVDGFSFPHMFYWDSYFIAQGFWNTEFAHEVLGMAENQFDLIRRFGFAPNSNSFSHLSRSQPPLLSTLVMQTYHNLKAGDTEWLRFAYGRVAEEYSTVWQGMEQPHNRMVHRGLSRYYDTNVLHVLAEAESGWDYTTRFENRCLDFLPVDLNAMLFKYETDLAEMAAILDDGESEIYWNAQASNRKTRMNEMMWGDFSGFYYDYNFRQTRRGNIQSLATYVPMWAGMTNEEQTQELVENLEIFETDHGLTTTAKTDEIAPGKQWAAPNGWAPLHDFVVDGLLRYGYEDEAKRIAHKWVRTVQHGYDKTGKIFEKYNVVDLDLAAGGAVYPDQHGFGWTNGVTYKFIQLLK